MSRPRASIPWRETGSGRSLIDLSRNQGVTIFVSTHFMNEAERCDRISLMDSGRVLATDTPAGLVKARGAATLEDAFIGYLEEATGSRAPRPTRRPVRRDSRSGDRQRTRVLVQSAAAVRLHDPRSPGTVARSDPAGVQPVRHGAADAGVRIRCFDRRQQSVFRGAGSGPESRKPRLSGGTQRLDAISSRRPPLADYADLDKRLKSGDIKAAIEIPPGFGRDIKRGRPAWVSALGRWRDAVPRRDHPRLPAGHASAVSGGSGREDDGGRAAAARRYRNQVQVQPGFRQHLRHGAVEHVVAARRCFRRF